MAALIRHIYIYLHVWMCVCVRQLGYTYQVIRVKWRKRGDAEFLIFIVRKNERIYIRRVEKKSRWMGRGGRGNYFRRRIFAAAVA